MIASIRKRLIDLEHRLMNLPPLWPGDGDNFLEALGISGTNKNRYRRVNLDGGVGYDVLSALNDLAAEIWKDGDDL